MVEAAGTAPASETSIPYASTTFDHTLFINQLRNIVNWNLESHSRLGTS